MLRLSKIWTETHWPFWGGGRKKRTATSFKRDTFSSSFTCSPSAQFNNNKPLFFSPYVAEKSIFTLMFKFSLVHVSFLLPRWVFPEWDNPLCILHQTHFELHLKAIISISCTCIGSSLFTLQWFNWFIFAHICSGGGGKRYGKHGELMNSLSHWLCWWL